MMIRSGIKVREEIVYRGVHEKFRQNPELAEKLERTGKEIIAECAVKDRIWGIGLSMEDENRLCIDKWRGQNLLGKVLMRVREDIRHQNRVTQAFQNVGKAFLVRSEKQDFMQKLNYRIMRRKSVMKRRKNNNGSF